jgi:hypothetical protein
MHLLLSRVLNFSAKFVRGGLILWARRVIKPIQQLIRNLVGAVEALPGSNKLSRAKEGDAQQICDEFVCL